MRSTCRNTLWHITAATAAALKGWPISAPSRGRGGPVTVSPPQEMQPHWPGPDRGMDVLPGCRACPSLRAGARPRPVPLLPASSAPCKFTSDGFRTTFLFIVCLLVLLWFLETIQVLYILVLLAFGDYTSLLFVFSTSPVFGLRKIFPSRDQSPTPFCIYLSQ